MDQTTDGFFSVLTRKRLRRGVFKGVVDLQAAINRYLKQPNADSKPFVWTEPRLDLRQARKAPCTFRLTQCTSAPEPGVAPPVVSPPKETRDVWTQE